VESKRGLMAERKDAGREESSIAFEAFWSKPLNFYFQDFLDKYPAVDVLLLTVWHDAKRELGTFKIWHAKLKEEKKASEKNFPIAKELLLGLLFHWELNYREASHCFKRVAATGDAIAQFFLGMYCGKGLGELTKNNTEAVQYLEKAANNSIPCSEALYELALAQENGDFGLPKDDPALIIKRYVDAANAGNGSAAYDLANKLLAEEGDEKYREEKAKEAVKFFRQAVAQGNCDALIKLSDLYQVGCGVPKDEVEADRLFDMATEISLRYIHLTPFLEFYTTPIDKFIEAAESGDPLKMVVLQKRMHEKIKVDREIIQNWIAMAEKEYLTIGLSDNKQMVLGTLYYYNGEWEKAKKCFSTLQQINPYAEIMLLRFQYEIAGEIDITEAINAYKRIVVKNPSHSYALTRLGYLYYKNKQYSLAEDCFNQVVKDGNAGIFSRELQIFYNDENVIHRANHLVKKLTYDAIKHGSIYCLSVLREQTETIEDEARYDRYLVKVFSMSYRLENEFRYAESLWLGLGISQNTQKALEILQPIKEVYDNSLLTVQYTCHTLGNIYKNSPEHIDIGLAAYYYRCAAQAGYERAKQKLLELHKDFSKTPGVVYNLAFIYPPEDKSKDAEDRRKDATELARDRPVIFDDLADRDDWEKIQSWLSDTEIAKSVKQRKATYIIKRQYEIGQATRLPADVCTIISTFFTVPRNLKKIRESVYEWEKREMKKDKTDPPLPSVTSTSFWQKIANKFSHRTVSESKGYGR